MDIEKEVITFLTYPEGGLIYTGIEKLEQVEEKYFHFIENCLRIVLPASEQITTQVTMEVTTPVAELLKIFPDEHTRQDL